ELFPNRSSTRRFVLPCTTRGTMILSFCMLTAMGTAPASPRFEPTVIEVDMSAFFSIKSEVSEGEEQREHDQIYPGVARVLEDAGIPIAAPQVDDDRELLEVASVPTVDVHARQAN